MKMFTKKLVLLLILSISWSSYSQGNSDDLGKIAVELLQEIRGISQADYLDNFVSKEFVETLYKYNKNNKFLKEMNMLSSKELNSLQINRLYRLRKEAASKGIIWEDIEFVDLVFEKPISLGSIDVHYITRDWIKNHYIDFIYGIGGWLYWRYNNKVYKSELSAIFVDNDYWLLKLEDTYLQD